MDTFKSVDASVGSGKKATRESKTKGTTTSGLLTRSLFTSATSSSLASGDQTDSDYIYKTDGGSIQTSDSKRKTVDVRQEYGLNATPESTHQFIFKKNKYKGVFEKVNLFPTTTSSTLASEDQSDSDWVSKAKTDVVPSNIPDSWKNVVHASSSKGKSAARGSKIKHKHKSTRGRKSHFSYVPISSLVSTDSSDSDWVCTTKTDVVPSNIPDSKTKVLHDSASKGKSATRESKNKRTTTKQKHKSTRGRKSRVTSAPGCSIVSTDSSDSDWVCTTKTDVVPSNIPDSKTKIVLARASKGKSATRESKNKLSPTKDKSTRGRKSRSTSVPSSSLASADTSGYGCRTGPVSRNTHNRKNKTVDAKAGPANVTRKWNNRMSPTRHKYKSILRKKKRVATPLSSPRFASVNPSGSGSMEKELDVQVSPFIDLSYWKMTRICCGIIFKGLNDEVMVDTKLFKPCKPRCKQLTLASETPQCNQSLDDTNLTSSISSTNAEETDLNSASNLSITSTLGKAMDA